MAESREFLSKAEARRYAALKGEKPIETAANQDLPKTPSNMAKLQALKDKMDHNETEQDDRELDEAMLNAWDEGLV